MLLGREKIRPMLDCIAGNTERKRPLERLRRHWGTILEDDLDQYLDIGVRNENWINVAQDTIH